MVERLFLILLFPFNLFYLHGQTVIDSLENKLSVTTEDTIRLDILYELIFEYSYHNPNKALELGSRALKVAEKTGDTKRIANINNGMGIAHTIKGNYLLSITHFLKALNGYEKMGNKQQAANVLNNIGITYDELGNYSKARSYYMECLDLYRGINNPFAVASILNNIGTAYEALDELDSAEFYYNESLELARNHNLKEKLADALLNLGSIYFKKNNLEDALLNLDSALKLDLENDNESGLVETYSVLAKVWLSKEDYPRAFEYMQTALDLSKKLGMTKRTGQIFKLYSEYYEKTGNTVQSLTYLKKYTNINDSIHSGEIYRQIDDLLFQYESAEKENTIAILTANNKLKDSELKLQRTQSGLLMIIAILAIITAILLWVNNKAKRKANITLAEQAEMIRTNNRILEDRNQKLEKLNQERDNFISLVAHDLKSPLNKILGLNNLITITGSLNEEQKDYLKLMSQVSLEAKRLIENILELDRLESGKLIVSKEIINLCELMHELAESYRSAAEAKKIKLQFNVPEEFTVKSNREFVYRIMENLISNAIKFSSNGKEVELGCKKENEHRFQIYVKDQGPGFKPSEKEQLFVKYKKLSARPTGGESSTGLGLAIVKLLVDYLEGEIEVKSIEKVGTTFIVRLPADGESEKTDNLS